MAKIEGYDRQDFELQGEQSFSREPIRRRPTREPRFNLPERTAAKLAITETLQRSASLSALQAPSQDEVWGSAVSANPEAAPSPAY
jgi:hypothetical protein